MRRVRRLRWTWCIGFQSTHPRGVRPFDEVVSTASAEFQSTHPRGVRLVNDFFCAFHITVSIHAPTRGATRQRSQHQHTVRVSIHAPTRGATHQHGPPRHAADVSIHAPTRGATKIRGRTGISRPFQSTHPRGVRPFTCFINQQVKSVSIHAPTRGATDSACAFRNTDARFNPRTHAGCDQGSGRSTSIRCAFQSTHPRGVRPARAENRMCSALFQSTHPRGVRQRARSWARGSLLFQSTHPRGVRPTSFARQNTERQFQSTHPRGVRRLNRNR